MKLEDLSLELKYKPKTLDDVILEGKESIRHNLEDGKKTYSFIFESIQPGTGKTSTALALCNEYDLDFLKINASKDRGVDVIRNKVSFFAKKMGLNTKKKKCILFDEADRLTPEAQDALKAFMDDYSKYVFFIFSTNNISKIIEPIKSRCITVNFSKPNQDNVIEYLYNICKAEKIKATKDELKDVMLYHYPDIRSMLKTLYNFSNSNRKPQYANFKIFSKAIREADIKYIYEQSYSNDFDKEAFVKYYLQRAFSSYDKLGLEKLKVISFLLADIEKANRIGVHSELAFLPNIIAISDLLKNGRFPDVSKINNF